MPAAGNRARQQINVDQLTVTALPAAVLLRFRRGFEQAETHTLGVCVQAGNSVSTGARFRVISIAMTADFQHGCSTEHDPRFRHQE